MSKSQCIFDFYWSSTWTEPSVESLLESPIAELFVNSKLLSISIPQGQGRNSGFKMKELTYKCRSYFYRSSNWLEPSVESLLESPIAELSINSDLLSISIPQDQGKTSRLKRRNPGINDKVTVYSCLLPEFYLTGALRRIFTGVP